MAKASNGRASAAEGKRHMTLTEVAKRTKISMPTLQKYKKRYAPRIPSQGKGRSQRYPENALAVFEQLRRENMARRGRPRKDGSAAGSGPPRRRGRPTGRPVGRPRKAASAAAGGDVLTLGQVAQRTKISYPTLLRYVKASLDRLPHVGSGRRRRFKPEAVAVFQQLRSESRPGARPGAKRPGRPPGTGARRGRPPGSGGASSAAVSRLTALVARLERRLARVEKELSKPLRIVRR